MGLLNNAETTLLVLELGIKKSKYSISKTILLGLMGGFYVALAGFGNLVAVHYIEGGLGKFIGACIFPTALMLVVIIGGSLFTGDALGWLAVAEKKISLWSFFKNLTAVWVGNFIGAVLFTLTVFYTGSFADAEFSETVVHIAEHKLHLTAMQSVFSGFLCNVLVAIGVWFALATDEVIGKIFAIWFPVMLFVFAGFQHVVANMFYINIGIFLHSEIFHLGDYINHFIFVTIGNFISGSIFLPLLYRAIYIKEE